MPTLRRAFISLVFGALLVALVPAAASAEGVTWLNEPCNTRHKSGFLVPGNGHGVPEAIQIKVKHEPGRFGHLTITRTDTDEEVWSFRQSYAWIWGYYEIRSPDLINGVRYRVDYWSDNLAQAPGLCRAHIYTVRVGVDT
jgi:hypothetical protein